MARKPTPQQLYQELLDRYGQSIAEAFQTAIEDLRAGAEIQRFQAAIEAGDLTAAIEALHLDPAAYNALLDEVQRAFNEGGQATAETLPGKDATGARLVFRFNGRNLRAEQYLRQQSSQLVTAILDDQRQAIRQALTAGMQRGENPRTTALNIVGRIDKATGKRVGGIVGLTAQQQQYVDTARQELASADPAAIRNYLSRNRRDARFDRTIQKALDKGEPVPTETISKAMVAYERRLQALRGEMIGRTEALRSLNAGAFEALQQAVDSGQVQASAVRLVWKSAHDPRVRHTHAVLDGQSVGLGEAFKSPSGASLRFPGDPLAPAAETIACRCVLAPRIDFLANIS